MERFVEAVSCPQCGAVLTPGRLGRLHTCGHCGALLRLDLPDAAAAVPPSPAVPEEHAAAAARVRDHLLAEFKSSTGIDLSGDAPAMVRIREVAEKTVYELSGSSTETEVSLPFITADDTGPKHLLVMVGKKVAWP